MDNYEMVDHPKHYNNYSVECIDMMTLIWGIDAAIQWCEMTAFKYRMRLGLKPDNPIEQDIEKERWYLEKAQELRCRRKGDKLINNLIKLQEDEHQDQRD